ncbi:MAG: chemotaxis protein CheW [Roseobacter sp.]
MSQEENSKNSDIMEFLSFSVSGQEYAVAISAIREIRAWTAPSSLPDSPKAILGVINLRGVLLPLLNLASRLGLSEETINERNVIIVAEVNDAPIGLVVDAVSDIVMLTDEDLQTPPETATSGDNAFVSNLAMIEETVVRILDLTKVFPKAEPVLEEAS